MSNETVTPMDPEQAYAHIYGTLYAPVFLEKLANDYGIVADTEEDKAMLLKMAGQLRASHDEAAQAPRDNSLLKAASSALDNYLGIPATDHAAVQQDRVLQQTGILSSFDPSLAHAVMSLELAGSNI